MVHARPALAGLLVPLALANGVTVSTLYWGQAVVSRAVAEFGPSALISLMPGATLFGYAAGVALLAGLAGDLTAPRGMGGQFALLVVALCAAATGRAALVLTISCLFIGLGCSLTQRLLTVGTTAVAPEKRAQTIGWIIAAGLCGIVIARAVVPALSDRIGWRGVFWIDAAMAGFSGLAGTVVSSLVYRQSHGANGPKSPRAAALWRGEATLRRAALQQAAVFAAFNMGWAVFPRLVGAGPRASITMGLVALLGAGAALVSGRVCGRVGPGRVARAGLIAVAVAAVALVLGRNVQVWVYFAMGALDSGTQVALVANQARAQALAATPAMRGRLAAIVTTIGFAGGAAGSAIGNLLAARL